MTQHVRNQDWFAVWLDFVIVVVGVFVGLQVSNWNDALRVQSLEKSYLVRLSEDLHANIEMFEAQTKFAEESRAILRQFLEALNDPSTSDADLERHMSNYVSYGTFLASYSPIHATFDDLKSTGNLDIIRDQELREALVQLHAIYDDSMETFDINSGWALQLDDDLYIRFDMLRFDSRTSALFPEQSTAATALDIRDNANLLTRHAAMHYWLKDRAIEVLEDSLEHSVSVLNRIKGAK